MTWYPSLTFAHSALRRSFHTSDVGHENWQLFMNPSGHLYLQTETSVLV